MATNNSVNNILGPANSLVMSSTGAMNLSQQPAFNYYLSANQNNVTGFGTSYKIPFDQIIFNQAGDFTAGVYTAPVAGNYLFTWCVALTNGSTSGATSFKITLNTTAAQYVGSNISPNSIAPPTGTLSLSGSVITSMAVGHTAEIDVVVDGLLFNTTGVAGGGAPVVTYFTGALLN